MQDLVTKIKELCEEYEGDVTYYEDDFCADDYAGGNQDDAWESGMRDGRTDLANDILGIIANYNKG